MFGVKGSCVRRGSITKAADARTARRLLAAWRSALKPERSPNLTPEIANPKAYHPLLLPQPAPKPQTPKPRNPKPQTPNPETPKPRNPKTLNPKPQTPSPKRKTLNPKPETRNPKLETLTPNPYHPLEVFGALGFSREFSSSEGCLALEASKGVLGFRV